MPVVTKQVAGTRQLPAKKEGVLSRIRPIGFDEDEGLKVLLYGRSGTGKTTIWATFPKPILAVLSSGGSQPGELRSIDTPEYRQTVQQVALERADEMRELVDYLNTHREEYATVVLDHATGLQDLILKDLLNLSEIPAQKGWGIATQQDWGQVGTQFKEYIRAILSLRCNVVIVAQEREFNTENVSDVIKPTVGAGLTPSITGWLNAAVDYICQTFIRQKEVTKIMKVGAGPKAKTVTRVEKVPGQVEYCLRTGADEVYTTKFRKPRGQPLPQAIVDPSYEQIYALARGSL